MFGAVCGVAAMAKDVATGVEGVTQHARAAQNRVLVPVSASPTMRETVQYAIETVRDRSSVDDPGTILFVLVEPMALPQTADGDIDTAVLERAAVWAEEACGETDAVRIDTAVIGEDEYVFSPADVADVLHDIAVTAGAGQVVLDPEYDPGIDMPLLRSLEAELVETADIDCEVAPVQRQVQRLSTHGSGSLRSFLTTFGIAFGFYLVLAGGLQVASIVTGLITATVVAVTVSRLLFVRSPARETPVRLVRAALYVPFLTAAVVQANLRTAAMILHPDLPIDTAMVRITPDVDGSLPMTLLANSITLTPGTLTARVDGHDLVIHTLGATSRDELLDGTLERAIQYIFHGTDGGDASWYR